MKKNVKKGKFLYRQQDFDSLISTLSSEYLTIAPDNVEEITHHWFLNISKSLNAERTVLFQKNEKNNFFISDAWTKESLEETIKYDPLASFPYIARQIAKGKTIIYSSPDDLPPEAAIDKKNIIKMGIASFLLFPLGSGEQLWGAFLFAFKTMSVDWDNTFIDKLRFITHIFSAVIKREMDRKTLENKIQFESLLADLSRDFISVGSEEIGNKITYWLHKAAETLNIKRALVFNLSAHNKFYISSAWKSAGGKEITPYDPEELFPWMHSKIIKHEPVIIPDISAFPPEAYVDKSNMPVIGALSVLVLPLVVQETLVGALAFSSNRPQFNLTEELVQRLRIVSQVFASALLQQKTEKNLAEEKERLAVTLKSIGDGVITTDIMGVITLLNDEAERITGWKSLEAEGKQIDEIFKIADVPTGKPLHSPVSEVLQTKSPAAVTRQTVLMDKSGSRKIITSSAAPIKDVDGNIIGVVLVFRDVTFEKKQEEELLKLKKLESIGVLAGGIAHDFNNILTGIIGNIDLAVMCGKELSDAHRYLEKASRGCQRAASLTQKLLTFSKGGAPIKKNASVGEIITESMDFILHGSKIKTKVSIPADLWKTEVDKEQISQVIQNLILNSMEAMPNGGVISVNCRNVYLGKDKYIQINIRDNGPGIPKENLDRIFDPYFSTKKTGSGLGLAVTFSIIQKHDGKIDVISKPGKGTEFIIHIPVHDSLHEEKKEDGTKKDTHFDKFYSILVMDDEKTIRNLLKVMLGKLGHKVTAVENGKKAIEAYRKNHYDLVILDITIPGGMGGIETIEKLKKLDPDVNALVSSGYANSPVLSEHKSYGFSGALAKPYLLEDLKSVIEKVMTSR